MTNYKGDEPYMRSGLLDLNEESLKVNLLVNTIYFNIKICTAK